MCTVIAPQENRQNYSFYILSSYIYIANWKRKDSAPNDSRQCPVLVCSKFLHNWIMDLIGLFTILKHCFFFYSRVFLFLKKQILVPVRRMVVCLNCRITMLSIKYVSIYALFYKWRAEKNFHAVLCLKKASSNTLWGMDTCM